jgi:hypothetical protein
MTQIYTLLANPGPISSRAAFFRFPESGMSFDIAPQVVQPHFFRHNSGFHTLQTTETAWPYPETGQMGIQVVPSGTALHTPNYVPKIPISRNWTRTFESGAAPGTMPNPEGVIFLQGLAPKGQLGVPQSAGAMEQARHSLGCAAHKAENEADAKLMGLLSKKGTSPELIDELWPEINWLNIAQMGCAPWDLFPGSWGWSGGAPSYIGGDTPVNLWEQFIGSPTAMVGALAIGAAALYFWSK